MLAASVLWGTTGTAAAHAPAGTSPLAVGAGAMGLGGLLLAVSACPATLRCLRRGEIRVPLVIGVAAVGAYPLAFYTSMHDAGVAVGVSVTIGVSPIFAAMIERMVNGRRLTRGWAIATVLGALGIGIMGMSVRGFGPGHPFIAMGIVLGLAAGAAYATYSWAASRLIAAGESPQGAMGAVFGLAALWLIPLAIATGGPLLRTADSLGIICYLAVGPMLVGYTLFGRGLRTNSASVATTLSLVEPVVAAALSEILLGQRLNGPARIGVALIAVSVLTLTIGSEQNPSISPAQQAPAAVGPTAPPRPHTGIAEA